MIIVSEISLTTPVILTLVSFGGFGVTALAGSAFAGAIEVPSAAKAQALKIKTKHATNTIRRFILSNLLVVSDHQFSLSSFLLKLLNSCNLHTI
jgi:hypothetical protein